MSIERRSITDRRLESCLSLFQCQSSSSSVVRASNRMEFGRPRFNLVLAGSQFLTSFFVMINNYCPSTYICTYHSPAYGRCQYELIPLEGQVYNFTKKIVLIYLVQCLSIFGSQSSKIVFSIYHALLHDHVIFIPQEMVQHMQVVLHDCWNPGCCHHAGHSPRDNISPRATTTLVAPFLG